MAQTDNPLHDPYLWLEGVLDDAALDWVRQRNAAARESIEAYPEFADLRARIRAVLDSSGRIPMVERHDDWLYNFWQDAEHPRGLWRRTSLAEYRKVQVVWETLLDVDALGRSEEQNWVWAGASCLAPTCERCLVSLSRGGADATVVREFDLTTRRFVADGFTLPEAKCQADWLDRDTLLIATDFGAGSLTAAGYPRVIKRWQRGQRFDQASTVFEADPRDMTAWFSVDRTPGYERTLVGRIPDFYSSRLWLLRGGTLQPLDKPDDAQLRFWRERVLIELRSDWLVAGKTYHRGSLLAADATGYLAGKREFLVLFEPTADTLACGLPDHAKPCGRERAGQRRQPPRRMALRWRERGAPHGQRAVSRHDQRRIASRSDARRRCAGRALLARIQRLPDVQIR